MCFIGTRNLVQEWNHIVDENIVIYRAARSSNDRQHAKSQQFGGPPGLLPANRASPHNGPPATGNWAVSRQSYQLACMGECL